MSNIKKRIIKSFKKEPSYEDVREEVLKDLKKKFKTEKSTEQIIKDLYDTPIDRTKLDSLFVKDLKIPSMKVKRRMGGIVKKGYGKAQRGY